MTIGWAPRERQRMRCGLGTGRWKQRTTGCAGQGWGELIAHAVVPRSIHSSTRSFSCMPVTIHRHHHRLGCGPSTFRKRTQPAQQGKDVRPSITPDASPSKTLKVLGEELSWETKNTAAGLGRVARRLRCAVAAQPPRGITTTYLVPGLRALLHGRWYMMGNA